MFNYIENHSSRTRSNEPCTPRCTVLKKGFLLSLMSLKRTCVGQDGLTWSGESRPAPHNDSFVYYIIYL